MKLSRVVDCKLFLGLVSIVFRCRAAGNGVTASCFHMSPDYIIARDGRRTTSTALAVYFLAE